MRVTLVHPTVCVLQHQDTVMGVLRNRDRALLINAPHPDAAAMLQEQGVAAVEKILLCSHRRDQADGLDGLLHSFDPDVIVPEKERSLFEDPETYWRSEASRWRLLCGHVPHHGTHVRPVAVAQGVAEGDSITWHGIRVRVLDTPGYTDGSVTYLVRAEGQHGWTAFVGDLIWDAGTVRDLHSLQRREERNGHSVGDYHGFMGAMRTLLDSLEKVLQEPVNTLVPAHGHIIDKPRDAVDLLRARFQTAYHNYASLSALRWYFPDYFSDHCADAGTLPMQETLALPPNVVRLHGTTWALLAQDGHAILLDPHSADALDAAAAAVEQGLIRAFDAIWLTHYHHDHVEAAQAARERFAVPVIADSHMAEIVAHPERFFLTCLSPVRCDVERATRDAESWHWRGMQLTAYHFPGQTYYHGGLFARPTHGPSVFFAGDALTPTGIDDYCSWNRNWLGNDGGFVRCLRLLRMLAPDIVINQHVGVGFRFSEQAYELLFDGLQRREALYRALLPWSQPNMGTDPCWAQAYPYEQSAVSEEEVVVDLQITNHLERAARVRVKALPPPGCRLDEQSMDVIAEPGRVAHCHFTVRLETSAMLRRCVIPFCIWVDDRCVGSMAEAVINVEMQP